MTPARSWQFIGPQGGLCDRLYSHLRNRLNRKLAAFLHQQLQSFKRNTVHPRPRTLESGSGPGSTSAFLASSSESPWTVCLDIDFDALQLTRKRDSSIPLVVGDMRQLPFSDKTFDLVFNNSTIEHLDNADQAIREMGRVCRLSGRVFVGVPFLWGPLGFQPIISTTAMGLWLGRVFTRRSLDKLLINAGLHPLTHIRYFLNFFIGSVATVRNLPPQSTPTP